MSRCVLVYLSLFLVTLSSMPALAQETKPEGAPAAQPPPAEPAPVPKATVPKVNALAEARAAREAGDHLAAAHAFEALYAAKCDPMVLYDIAVQREDGDDLAGALAYYTRFMTEAKKAPSGLRQSIGPRIAELSLELKRRGLAGSPAKTVACGDEVALEAQYSGRRPKTIVKPSPAPTPVTAAAEGTPPGAQEASEAGDATDEGETPDAQDPKAGVLLELELLPGSDWRGSLLIGASFGKLALGVGLEAYELPLATGAEIDASAVPTAVLIMPGVRLRMAESDDGKIECLAAFDLGLGTTLGGEDPAGVDLSTFLINWRVGPALRYWLNSQFALAVRVGIGAEHVRLTATQDAGGGKAERNYSDVGTFGALQVIGRF
jgi:hypothetical protein